MASPFHELQPEVLIVGAGPVGLLLANLLGAAGVRCVLVEKRTEQGTHSRAIGITPPSLLGFQRLGLDQKLIALGVRVEEAVVSDGRRTLGHVEFRELPAPYPFLLAVPQIATMRLLADNLAAFPSVTYRTGLELVGLEPQPDKVRVRLLDHGTQAEWWLDAPMMVGCDGHRSTVRELSGIGLVRHRYRPQFFMGDFEDRTTLGRRAHLFFTARGSVESFPLPGQLRRWVVLADVATEVAPPDYVARRVRELAGFDLAGSRQFNQVHFQPERLLCARYYRGRVALCGDAAHVMSPIGGQGMNNGFADAELLTQALVRICREDAATEPLLRQYNDYRRRAFRVAAARAARGMWLGTRTGYWASAGRSWLIESVLLRPPVAERLPGYFAMLTIPFNFAVALA